MDIYEIVKLYLKKNNLLKDSNDVDWDKSTEGDELKCKIDNINQVNVIYQNDFDFIDSAHKKGIDIAISILKDCFENFDKNNYPIIIIEDNNGGGYKIVSDYFTEYLNLNKPNYIYSAYRFNNDVENNIAPVYGEIKNYKTWEFESYQEIFKSSQEIDYGQDSNGNEIKHKITQLFDSSTIEKNKFYDYRKMFKNIRKPNEIIIFTDGYSYSATSNFIKEIQLRKGAIIVGYGGDPQNKIFDSSLSPSTVRETKEEPDTDEIELENLGYSLTYTVIESFTYYDNIKYPMEFEIININERVDLYNKYDDTRYQEFIDEAKKIFNKYNNDNCNSENKNIILLSDECDDNLGINTHGGYECDDNNKWSDKCVPLYCDIGYYFDIIKKKCVEDPCYLVYKEDKELKEKQFLENVFMILWIVFCIVFVVILVVVIVKRIKSSENYICVLLIACIICLILFVIFLFLWLDKSEII